MAKKLDDTIEISDDDDEPTYYGSDFSFSEDSDNDSVQIICEIENSSQRSKENFCKAIVLELLQKIDQLN